MPNLSGLRIVVTRATHQAEELAAPLREVGAHVLLVPVIGIAAPYDPAPLREAAAQCDQFDWIIFTSANAVNAFAAELPEPRSECPARIATVGPATRDAAERCGLTISLVPVAYIAESLVDALGREDLKGKRVLIPSAAVTRDIVPEALRGLGAKVDVVEAYRNIIPSGAAERVAEVFRPPLPDWITFASSSAVENTVKLGGLEPLRNMKIASIGPITSATIQEHGLTVAAEARIHTVDGLLEALRQA